MGLLLGGIGSSFLGLVLFVAGIATTEWLSAAQGGQGVDIGLFQVCADVFGVSTCAQYQDLSKLSGGFHATRAFAVIGPLLLIPGIAVACFARKQNSGKLKKIGGALIVAAGLCGLVAAAIFTGDANATAAYTGIAPPFGYSFYLTWAQTLFTVAGGAAIIVAGFREGASDEVPVLRA